MATKVVKVSFNDSKGITVDPETVQVDVGDTVTWVGPKAYLIQLPPPLKNPDIQQKGDSWSGETAPFLIESQRYKYNVALPDGPVVDPIIQVLP